MKRFKCLYIILLITVISLWCDVICATTITIDPGTGGTTFKEIIFPFNDLNGNSLTSISPLEFVFSDSKFITLSMNDDTIFNAELTITFSAAGEGFVPVPGGSLRDGDNTINNNAQGSAGGGDTDKYTMSWYTWNDPLIDGFVFSSVYFNNIGFRTYPEGTTIESASLKLQIWGNVHNGIAEVGPTPPQELTVIITGEGLVTSDPIGISCNDDCFELYDNGTIVTLTAAPSNGSTFVGWSGDCTGTELTCDVMVDQVKNVSAEFNSSFSWSMVIPSIINNAKP